jgi:hypothetical protein
LVKIPTLNGVLPNPMDWVGSEHGKPFPMLHRKPATNYPAKHAKFGKFSEGNYSLFCRKSMWGTRRGMRLET